MTSALMVLMVTPRYFPYTGGVDMNRVRKAGQDDQVCSDGSGT